MTGNTAETLIEQGYEARRGRRLAEARMRFAEAVQLCRESSDQLLLAQALTGLGQMERDLDQLNAALKCYQEAVSLHRRLDRPLVLAHTIRHVADILRNQAQLDLASSNYAEALAIYRAHAETPPLDLANALRGYALLKASNGDKEGAAKLWQEAGVLYAAAGVEAGVAESEAQVARLIA
jgi:tetratricopeptide (TPR) repeat protein